MWCDFTRLLHPKNPVSIIIYSGFCIGRPHETTDPRYFLFTLRNVGLPGVRHVEVLVGKDTVQGLLSQVTVDPSLPGRGFQVVGGLSMCSPALVFDEEALHLFLQLHVVFDFGPLWPLLAVKFFILP